MGAAVAISLACIALTFAFFLLVNVEKFVGNRRGQDLLGALWSLVMALWFGYAAIWVLLHAR